MVENLHHVKPGETLYSISHRYGLTVTDLTQANSLSTPSLQAGQVLQLPINKEADSEPDQAIRNVAFSQNIRTASHTTHYTIKRGDTLFAIAQRFAVSVSDLRSWNSILHKISDVKAGKRIVIRGSY
jgi:LysM repeat protein